MAESIASDRISRRVIAACGCGHDGRLGIGDPPQPNAVLSTSSVTLIPFFVNTLPSMGDSVRSVHCGGYHTIVVTESGALYGWGLHEEGQLGLGRPGHSEGAGKYNYWTPTRLTFFDDLYNTECKGKDCLCEKKEFILDVSCGASHSVVLTQSGLYVTGKNTHGQLGTGSDVDVYEWAPLVSLTGGRSMRGREVIPCDDSLEFLPANYSSRQKNYVSIIKGTLTHISCGTHHTLLGWKNALIERNTDPDATAKPSIEYHPLLIVAAGKGDFGELGYDGDQLSIIHAQEKRQYSALQGETLRTSMQGGVNTDDNGNPHVAPQSGFTGNWWKKMRKTERRPEFFSTHFLPVQWHEKALVDTVVQLSGSVSSGIVEEELAQRSNSSARGSAWELLSLRAMHLHSAATLVQRDAATGKESVHVYHWGCYYCGKVEGMESSVPTREEWDGGAFALHAGNEVLLRYRLNEGAGAMMARGSGVIGTGEDDALAEEWVPVAFASPSQAVLSLEGRDHFVFLLKNSESSSQEAWGFGANLHGQLGMGGKEGRREAEEEEGVVLAPSFILCPGDILHCPHDLPASRATSPSSSESWKVLEVRYVGAGVNHSMFLIDIEKQ